jgi:Cu/Ag efflux protein CusF
MKRLAFVVALAVPSGALAQQQSPNEPGYTIPGASGSGNRPRLTEQGRSFRGEVKDVDKVSGTVTLRHGPIGSLGVPEGTKEYQVKDASMLAHVKAGDAVRFGVILQGRSLLVTHIEPAN